MSELSIKQIIHAAITILVIIVIAFAMLTLFPSVANGVKGFFKIGISSDEIEAQSKSKEIGEDLRFDLSSCINPGGKLDKKSCFCLDKNIDLPNGYSFKFSKEEDNIKIELLSDKEYSFADYSVNGANLKVCLGLNFKDCEIIGEDNNVVLTNAPPWIIKSESKLKNKDNNINESYVFYYYFDSNDNKVYLNIMSRVAAYSEIKKGVSICGQDENITYTNEMDWLLVRYLYK